MGISNGCVNVCVAMFLNTLQQGYEIIELVNVDNALQKLAQKKQKLMVCEIPKSTELGVQ